MNIGWCIFLGGSDILSSVIIYSFKTFLPFNCVENKRLFLFSVKVSWVFQFDLRVKDCAQVFASKTTDY